MPYLYGATSATINSQISGGMRPFSIKHVGSLTYDVVFVSNTGPYAVTGSVVYYNQTPTQLTNALNNNNRRILDLTVFDDGSGNTRMTAITVPNSGATSTPAWGWMFDTSFSTIANWMSQNPTLRLIDLDVYRIGSTTYYSAVAVHNSGNNQQGWWYYNSISAAQVSQLLTQNNARLVQLEVVSPGVVGLSQPTFAVVMVSSNPGEGWWYSGLSTQQVSDLINQNGARITALTRYTPTLGSARWAVAMVDNVNAQTRRMRSYVGSSITNGTYGFRLKQVGGPVLASLNENFVYEPASMLKILHATYAIRQCALGNDNLTNDVFVWNRCHEPNWRDMCPVPMPSCNAGNEPLSETIRSMMQASHNSRTRTIEDRYTRATLNNFATARGLTNTRINHTMGCGPMTNTMTATDAVSLYEQISTGGIVGNTTWRDQLFSLMVNLNLGWSNYPTLDLVIAQEFGGLGLSNTEYQSFRNAMHMAHKSGGYGWDNLFYKTTGAWASIPFKTGSPGNWVITPRQYALAVFIHGSSNNAGSNVVYMAKEEILREQIREALESWVPACDPPAMITNPQDRTAPLGGSTSFSASASGSFYNREGRWQREASLGPITVYENIVDTPGRFSGATSTTLHILNIEPGDARRYRYRVTNRCGAVNSATARLTIGNPCYANCDESTTPPVLNIDDFTCFINSFASGQALPPAQQISHYANCDGSTTSPVLNIDDFTCFINSFALGCP